jgi:hypothetical protein
VLPVSAVPQVWQESFVKPSAGKHPKTASCHTN